MSKETIIIFQKVICMRKFVRKMPESFRDKRKQQKKFLEKVDQCQNMND